MRKIAVTILIAAAIGACIFFITRSSGACRPNIILVSIDTLRADHLSCYGYERKTSPFLDSLARNGIRFEDAIVQSNWTLPSHVSMLTSLYPAVHGVQRKMDKMSPGLNTMAEMLKKAGYSTAAFTDGGFMSAGYGFDQGFDLYDDHSRGRQKNKRVLYWIKKQQKKPFFLFYHTYDVHAPYAYHPKPRTFMSESETKDITARIRAGNCTLTDEEFEKTVLSWCTVRGVYKMIGPSAIEKFEPETRRFFKERWPRMASFNESLRYLVDAYDGSISHFDSILKGLWELMCKMGVDKKTLLIVTSDHGEAFMEHGDLGHPEILYDEIVRVPLIMAGPMLPQKGLTVRRQVMIVDILPTVLDLLKLKSDPHLQGESLMPLIRGVEGSGPRPAYADALDIDAVRTSDWKFIQRAEERDGQKPPLCPVPQLFNLEKDPGENTDLSNSDASTREMLGRQLQEWRAENGRLRIRLGLDKAAEKVTLDKETVEELRALGYLQ
jgi:arylsulfatase A-like enzyme